MEDFHACGQASAALGEIVNMRLNYAVFQPHDEKAGRAQGNRTLMVAVLADLAPESP
jgi:hypothetical protein